MPRVKQDPRAPGPRNAITDVAGLVVGNASDPDIRSGVTVLTADEPFVCGVDVRGGAPGTREIALLDPSATVERVHALVLSGGSAFGLGAADGVMAGLRERGVGFPVGPVRVPVVPAAILFDLLNGGRGWNASPYPALGRSALDVAGPDFAIGTAGAGTGATTADAKGGLGTASLMLTDGTAVGALVAVNAVGSVLAGGGPHFLAAPHEIDGEFGGLGVSTAPATVRLKGREQGTATTVGVVATNAALDKAGCRALAMAAQAGLAQAIWPVATPLDGDLVFGVATGTGEPIRDPATRTDLAIAAASAMARAVARGVHAAKPEPVDLVPSWRARFG